jgi:predicted ATPase/DNA-binding winged helix-turn-helix (wHTH) protein
VTAGLLLAPESYRMSPDTRSLPDEIRLTRTGAAVPVGGRAFEVIDILVRSIGKIVTKDELMDRIWPGAIVTENTLVVHTMAVRKALGPYRSLLKTESRRGYRLLGQWTIQREDAVKSPVGVQQLRIEGESPVTNFPALLIRLIGRSEAVARLRDLVSAYRVVTLTGPGGIGKTSLALKVARIVLDEFPDGGWLAELASLSDPALVPIAVAGALRVPTVSASVTPETIARSIGDKKLILVLDDCEHLIEAVAPLAETLLQHCPHITIIATSRETLGIQGEHVYRLPPLEVPAAGRDEVDHILSGSAVELSSHPARRPRLERAKSAKRSCKPVATCCIPNVEVAVAANSMASGMPSRCRQITPMLGSSPARGEKLASNASLVVLDRDTGSRWYLLETIRAYALEKLAGHSERDRAARRHARYFRDLFPRLPQALPFAGISADERAHRVREIDNIRAALDTAEAVDDLETQAPALVLLFNYHSLRAERDKALELAKRFLTVAGGIGDATLSHSADRNMGVALVLLGRPRQAREFLERYRKAGHSTPDQQRALGISADRRALTRVFLSLALWLRGFIDQAWREVQASLAGVQATDPPLALLRVLYFGVCRIVSTIGDSAAAEHTEAPRSRPQQPPTRHSGRPRDVSYQES